SPHVDHVGRAHAERRRHGGPGGGLGISGRRGRGTPLATRRQARTLDERLRLGSRRRDAGSLLRRMARRFAPRGRWPRGPAAPGAPCRDAASPGAARGAEGARRTSCGPQGTHRPAGRRARHATRSNRAGGTLDGRRTEAKGGLQGSTGYVLCDPEHRARKRGRSEERRVGKECRAGWGLEGGKRENGKVEVSVEVKRSGELV